MLDGMLVVDSWVTRVLQQSYTPLLGPYTRFES
jgi:hypothetical protein